LTGNESPMNARVVPRIVIFKYFAKNVMLRGHAMSALVLS
jgi:hypothetical protein